jgi:hypothetical protein
MKFEVMTAVLCLLGWALHWLTSWGEAFKADKTSLSGYIAANPPAFYVSVLATIAAYMIGPDLLTMIGVDLPTTGGVKLLGSFAVGYFADSAVYKFANLAKKVA